MSTMSRTRQVVLTGATGPIGRHVAERLAERGHALALVVKDRAKGEALAATLRASSPRALPTVDVFEADLSSVVSVQALVQTLSSKLTHVDVLVNAAALTSPSPTRETSADGVERTFAINALAPFQLMVGLGPLLGAASGRKLGHTPTGGQGGASSDTDGTTGAKPTMGGGAIPLVKDAGPMLAVPTTPQAVVALSGGFGTQQEGENSSSSSSSSSSLRHSGTKASMARIVNLCWATSAEPYLVSSSEKEDDITSSHRPLKGMELGDSNQGKGGLRNKEDRENVSTRRDVSSSASSQPLPPNFHGRLKFGFPPPPTPPWLLRCAEDEALEREEQRKKSAAKKNKEHNSTGRENARSDSWLDAEKKAADRGISDDRQRPFYYTTSTTLSRGGRDAKRFRNKATAAMLAREKRRIQEEAYVRAVKSGWLQRGYNSAVGAEEWFVLEEVDASTMVGHASKGKTKAPGSNSSGSSGDRNIDDDHSSLNSNSRSTSHSSSGYKSSDRKSRVGADRDFERKLENAREGSVYDEDEEFLLAAKVKKNEKDQEATTTTGAEIASTNTEATKGTPSFSDNSNGGGDTNDNITPVGNIDKEQQRQEDVVGLWSAVSGPFDAYALATGNGYDAKEAFVQSQVAARMLTWAAAAHFKEQNLDVAVHACHPGALATRRLLARGFKDDVSGGRLLSARTASSCASFLAADRRIEAMGNGPHYWNERIRVQPCAYMPQVEQCSVLWRTAKSIVEAAMGAAAVSPPPPVK